jgi:hypothetical protein
VKNEPRGRKVTPIADVTSTALGKVEMVVPVRREQCSVYTCYWVMTVKQTTQQHMLWDNRFLIRNYTVCPGSIRTYFLNVALQFHLLASCGIKILEVSAVAVYNFKAQASLHYVF